MEPNQIATITWEEIRGFGFARCTFADGHVHHEPWTDPFQVGPTDAHLIASLFGHAVWCEQDRDVIHAGYRANKR